MTSSKHRRVMADMLREKMQIETGPVSALSEIFAEEPPSLATFVGDAAYMNNPPLGPIQYDFVRHFEQVLYPETYILMVEEFGPQWAPVRYISEMVAQWGKGAGKDHVCQLGFARVANIVLSLKDPIAYYEMPHQHYIHMLNVAASSGQAQGVFFKPLRGLLTSSPWFADKFEGEPPKATASSIHFIKHLELISGHSSAETLEGKNLLAAIADEISAFPTLAEAEAKGTGRAPAKTADGILDMLRSSATTRFPITYKMAQISFPRVKGDAIQQATLMAKEDNDQKGEASRYYVSGPHITWDVNPKYDKFERVHVPGASGPVPNVPDIVKDYENKPAYARGKYECNPERSSNRYFKSDTSIFGAFNERLEVPPLRVDYVLGYDESEEGVVRQWQAVFSYADRLTPIPGALYSLHADMAIKGDRAGIAMAHVRKWDETVAVDEDGLPTDYEEFRPTVKIDFATAFTADEAALDGEGGVMAREVQIRWFRKLVVELTNRGFPIGSVTMDGFQSADTLQILQARGIEAKKQSMDSDMTGWKTLRDVMYEGRLEGYWHELLISELQSLTQMGNGKVDHPPGGSKDIADAVAGAVLGAVNSGGAEEDEEALALGVTDEFSVEAADFSDFSFEVAASRAGFSTFGETRSMHGEW